MIQNNENLWILTEERPKKAVIEKIIEKTSLIKNLNIKIEKFKIEPLIEKNKFLHSFKISKVRSDKIQNIFIRLISSRSSFVDFLVFLQEKEPKPEQILKNCVYAIEETKMFSEVFGNFIIREGDTHKFHFKNTLGKRGGKDEFKTRNDYWFSKRRFEEMLINKEIENLDTILYKIASGT